MAEQLALGEAPKPTGPATYTIEQHTLTKRLFAFMWADGWIIGIAGPYLEPPSTADLPGLSYDHNATLLRHITQDVLNKVYARYITPEELAS